MRWTWGISEMGSSKGCAVLAQPYVGGATGSRTAPKGGCVPEPEWSVGGLKLGVAATKSGLLRKVWWGPPQELPRAVRFWRSWPAVVCISETMVGAATGSRTAPKGGSAPEPLLCILLISSSSVL